MLSQRVSLVVVLLIATAVGVLSLEAPAGRIVTQLPSLQTPSGGFADASGEVTLKATSQALFLAKLYGVRDRLNLASVPGFIRTCERRDGGYGQTASASVSDLSSVYDAVVSFRHLGEELSNADQVRRFVLGRFDRKTGLASNADGQSGSIRATAVALQTLELLGALQNAEVTELFPRIKEYLASHVADASHFAFDDETAAAGQYYGSVVAVRVGYSFDSTQFSNWVGRRQSTAGGFFVNELNGATSIEATSQSVGTLFEIAKVGGRKALSLAYAPGVRQFVANIPENLNDAALAHAATAITGFEDQLRLNVEFQPSSTSLPIKESRAVTGTRVKPVFTAKAFGVPHSSLEVDVIYTLPGDSTPTTQRLTYSAGQYALDDFIDTADRLGDVLFTFRARTTVDGVGAIVFDSEAKLAIGYGIRVSATGVHALTGKEVHEGEAVTVGTRFDFDVTLFTSVDERKTTGDFELDFVVFDSSDVAVYAETIDGSSRDASQPLAFSWEFSDGALPPGWLTFRFDVRATGSDRVHTTEQAVFIYSVTLAATEIEFEDAPNDERVYTLGSTVSVSVRLAALPDPKTPLPLATTDANGASIAQKRRLFLDASTPAGAVLRAVPGVPDGERVRFDLELTDKLELLGTVVVSFRYITAGNHMLAVANYDSLAEEVLDDALSLNFTVSVDLQARDITEEPAASSALSYGNEVRLHFNLYDASSGRKLRHGERQKVFLLLNHVDTAAAAATTGEQSAFVSSKQAAESDGAGGFLINWKVDPNAIRGAGFLTLVAEDPDGSDIAITREDGSPIRYDVTIGGDIDVQFSGQSTSNPFFSATAFVGEFSLSSAGAALEGAQLTAEVSSGSTTTVVPVAAGPDGLYSVSWTAPHNAAHSGTYRIAVYRDADRNQAAQVDANTEKKLRKERRERELRTGTTEEGDIVVSKTAVTPLFVKEIKHEQAVNRTLPIRTELLALSLFGYVFYRVWEWKSKVSTN